MANKQGVQIVFDSKTEACRKYLARVGNKRKGKKLI